MWSYILGGGNGDGKASHNKRGGGGGVWKRARRGKSVPNLGYENMCV